MDRKSDDYGNQIFEINNEILPIIENIKEEEEDEIMDMTFNKQDEEKRLLSYIKEYFIGNKTNINQNVKFFEKILKNEPLLIFIKYELALSNYKDKEAQNLLRKYYAKHMVKIMESKVSENNIYEYGEIPSIIKMAELLRLAVLHFNFENIQASSDELWNAIQYALKQRKKDQLFQCYIVLIILLLNCATGAVKSSPYSQKSEFSAQEIGALIEEILAKAMEMKLVKIISFCILVKIHFYLLFRFNPDSYLYQKEDIETINEDNKNDEFKAIEDLVECLNGREDFEPRFKLRRDIYDLLTYHQYLKHDYLVLMSNNILKSYMSTSGLASIMIDPIMAGVDIKIEQEEEDDDEDDEIIFDDEIMDKIISENALTQYLPIFREESTLDAIQELDIILENKKMIGHVKEIMNLIRHCMYLDLKIENNKAIEDTEIKKLYKYCSMNGYKDIQMKLIIERKSIEILMYKKDYIKALEAIKQCIKLCYKISYINELEQFLLLEIKLYSKLKNKDDTLKYVKANSKIILKNKNEIFQVEAQNVILSILSKNSREDAEKAEGILNEKMNKMMEWNLSLKADTYFNYAQIYNEIIELEINEYSIIFKYLNESLYLYYKLKNWAKIIEIYYFYAKIFYDGINVFNEDFYDTMEVIELMEEKMRLNDLNELDKIVENMYDGLYVPYAFSKYIAMQ